METGQPARPRSAGSGGGGGGGLPSRSRPRDENLAALLIHQKAAWQKIVDSEGSNAEKWDSSAVEMGKRKKKIVARSPHHDVNRGQPTMNGNSRRPFSALGLGGTGEEGRADNHHLSHSQSQNNLISKKALQDLKYSTLMNPRVTTPRKCVSAMGAAMEEPIIERHQKSREKRANISNDDQSSDLDFTEKLRAFRALVSLKKKTNEDTNKEKHLSNAYHLTDKLEESGKFLKFSSQSIERSEIQCSSPNYTLNEFQMTYEHDREMKRKKLLMSEINHVLDADLARRIMNSQSPTKDISDREANDTTTGQWSSGDPTNNKFSHMSVNESSHSKESRNMKESSHDDTLTRTRKSCLRVIKRPDNFDQNSDEKRKVEDNYYISENKNVSSIRTSVGRSISRGEEERVQERRTFDRLDSFSSGNEKVVTDTEQFEASGKAFQKLSDYGLDIEKNPQAIRMQRPASVNTEIDRYNGKASRVDNNSSSPFDPSVSFLAKPHRAVSVMSVSDWHYDDAGHQRSKSMTSDNHARTLTAVNDVHIMPQASLKAHLNVLGASLSSLSSRLNSDSSDSDGRSLTSDLNPRLSRSSSLNTLLTMTSNKAASGGVAVGVGLVAHSEHGRLPFKNGMIPPNDPFDVRQVEVSVRDRHHLHTVRSPLPLDQNSATHSALHNTGYSTTLRTGADDEQFFNEFPSAKFRSKSLQNISQQEQTAKPKQTNVSIVSTDSSLHDGEDDYESSSNQGLSNSTHSLIRGVKDLKHSKNVDSDSDDRYNWDNSSVSTIREHRDDLRETADYIAKLRQRESPRAHGRSKLKGTESQEELEKTLTEQEEKIKISRTSLSSTNNSKSIQSRSAPKVGGDINDANPGYKRIISRKFPIPRNDSQSNVRDGDQVKMKQLSHHEVDLRNDRVREGKAGENVKTPKESAVVTKERKRILVKRPPDHKAGSSHGTKTLDSSKPVNAAPSRGRDKMVRSHSALGISSNEKRSDGDRKTRSKTPTQAKTARGDTLLSGSDRPHSSLGTISRSAIKKTPSSASSPNVRSKSTRPESTPVKGGKQEACREKLYEKVQRLHQEIDARLKSDENVSLNYRLRKKRSQEVNGELSSDDDANDHDTITNEEMAALGSSRSLFSDSLYNISQALQTKQKHETKHVRTSTPLKFRSEATDSDPISTDDNTNRSRSGGRSTSTNSNLFGKSLGSEILHTSSPRMGIKSLNLDPLPDAPQSKLSERLKAVIAARNRLTPDLGTIQRRAKLFNYNNDNNANDDDDDDDGVNRVRNNELGGYLYLDDDKDEDETQSLSRHRSGSVGSKHPSNKRDFVSRILGKMAAGGTDNMTSQDVMVKDITSTIGRSMYNRAPSPADTLLGYLDNPNMVNLLQKLYKADPLTRQVIMVKVQHFKAWQQFSSKAKQKRLWKESMQERADTFCYERLLALHFITWERRATHSRHEKKAAWLFRQHMLVKGFRALKWSVSHSRHQAQQLQARVHTITTRTSFFKWKFKAEKQRRDRMEDAIQRWKQFVTEAQKIRYMQNLQDNNTMHSILTIWRKRYNKRVKENLAFQYLRRTLLKHALTDWCGFIAMSKRKKEKFVSAVTLHQKHLVSSTFCQMVVAFKKSKRARNHFKQQKLYDVFWAWKQAGQICRSERKADMETSVQHWQRQCIKQTFARWREKLMLCKAEKHSDLHLCKNVFNVWGMRWQENVAHRKEIEVTIERNKLHRALLRWRRNVVQIQRCHRQAVTILEKCHLRHTLRVWRMYSIMRTTLKRKIYLHQYAQQKRIQASCFASWLSMFQQRVDEVKARQLWSHSCARKVAVHWKMVCHKRFLERQLQESHTDRELRFVRAMFNRWLQALERNEKEKEEAEEIRKNLERSHLQRRFLLWKAATQRVLLIKPLLVRLERQSLSQCFSVWHSYIRKVVCCRQSKIAFEKLQLAKAFSSWRSQCRAHEVEKQVKNSMTKGLRLYYLHEWRFFVWRRKECLHFRQLHLVKKTFFFWKERAAAQFSVRAEKEEEEENNLELKRTCFSIWLQNIHEQQVTNDRLVGNLIQIRASFGLKKSFCTWRRQMHSAIIARSYQKTAHMRLAQTFLSAWHELTTKSMSLAVCHFAEKIGLAVSDDLNLRSSQGHLKRLCSSVQGDESDFNTLLEDGDVLNTSLNGSLSSTFSMGSSARRLFGETERSIDSDVDRHFLLSGGLQDVMDEHTAKCHRLRENVKGAIIRLRHWPIYTAFQQWVEFTARQRELKETAKRVKDLSVRMETKLIFRRWRTIYLANKTSKQYSNTVILSSNFGALVQYCRHRKYVKELSLRAHRYCMLLTFQKFFPIWLSKAQKQRQEKHVMELWTTRTEREIELFPLESKLKQRFGSKTVRLCFSIWLLKYRHFEKIQRVYHTNLLQWLFGAWKEWAIHRHHRRLDMEAMVKRRQTLLAFQTWKNRFSQSREIEKRFQSSWRCYLHEILVEWHSWTKDTKQRKASYTSVVHRHCRQLLSSTLSTWRSLAMKSKTIKINHEAKIICCVFKEWRSVTTTSKVQKEKVLRMQVSSYTLLVKRLFHEWHGLYIQQKLQKEEKLRLAENSALKLALIWRHKCQKSRGRQLHQMFQQRQLLVYFQTWKSKYNSVMGLYDKLDERLQKKNVETLRCFLKQWTIRLHGDQAARLFQCRMLYTVLKEWKTFAKENRERRIRGLALQKALQERSLHVYFQYWKAVTRVKQSVQHNADTKLQMKIIAAWLSYTRNMRYLRKLQEHMSQRVNTRILTNAFTNLRWRAEYCQSLNEVADRMLRDRTNATLRAVIVMWKDRLDRILAARCYGHILAVRTSRRWSKFVIKRKTEREKDKSDLEKAVQLDQKHICQRAFQALKIEVTVSKLAQKRRQRLCDNYAAMWKLRVDLQVTAMEMEWDLTCRRSWRIWRKMYSRRTAARQLIQNEDERIKAQIFKAWVKMACSSRRNTVSRKSPQPPSTPTLSRRSSNTSFLPVPVGQARTSPSPQQVPPSPSQHFGFRSGKNV